MQRSVEVELEIKRWRWSRNDKIRCFIPKEFRYGLHVRRGAASYRYGDGGIHGLDNEIVILVESVYYFHEQPGNAHLFSYL